MAEISGENGAVYFNEEITNTATSGTLVFSTGGTIESSTACGTTSGPFIDFETEGYVTGMLVTVSGCTKDVPSSGTTTGNNRIFTITGVSTSTLTVSTSETVVGANPEASTGVIFEEAEPGIQVLGFFNWALSHTGDVLETTDFDSTGGRSYIAGLTGWTATADKHFLTANNEVDDWVGTAVEIRLFLNYLSSTSTPSTGSPSRYWKGDTIVTGIDETTPVDALVDESISFQGDGALTLKTQTRPWNEGIST